MGPGEKGQGWVTESCRPRRGPVPAERVQLLTAWRMAAGPCPEGKGRPEVPWEVPRASKEEGERWAGRGEQKRESPAGAPVRVSPHTQGFL